MTDFSQISAESGPEAAIARQLSLRMVAAASALLLAAMVVLSFFALDAFERHLLPEIAAKEATLARTIERDLALAIRNGIPLQDLRGVDAYLDNARKEHEEVAYIAFVDPDNTLLFATGNITDAESDAGKWATIRGALEQYPPDAPSGAFNDLGATKDIWFPVTADGLTFGRLHIGVDPDYEETQVLEIVADILIVLFISVLITLEVLLLMMTVTVTRSLTLIGQLMAAGSGARFDVLGGWRSRDELGRLVANINSTIQALNRRYEGVLKRYSRVTGQSEDRSRAEAALSVLDANFARGGADAIAAIRQAMASDVRLPLFIYIFGIELSRSFFPLYVRELYQPIPFLSEQVTIALPMSLWVAAMLLTTPFGGRFIQRFGARTVLIAGMIPSVFGLFMTAFASNFYELLLWRAITASGFGVVTVTALVFVARFAGEGRRARGLSIFVAASVAASVCATSIGGILADRIGFRGTFLVASVLVILALLLVLSIVDAAPKAKKEAQEDPSEKKPRSPSWALIGNPKLMLFMAFSAVPARVILTGLFFFLVPLYLADLDFDRSAIGRIMMVYFVAMLVLTPVTANLADRFRAHRLLLIGGGIASACGALILAHAPSYAAQIGEGMAIVLIVLGVALIGVGQSFTMTPLMSFLPDGFRAEAARYGLESLFVVFRTVERLGSISGPIIVALMVQHAGLAGAAGMMGFATLAVTTGLLVFFFLSGVSTARPQQPDPPDG